MRLSKDLWRIAATFLVASCTVVETGGARVGTADEEVIEVTLHPDRERQTIHNFGASDAWSIQFVGEHWPEVKRERIADLLFSTDTTADGSPIGIGLSAWRFNLGAGSVEQGRESGIRDRWRRAESFLRADGSFDAAAQPGQRAFLRAARARGVEQFYAFTNSPPVAITRNGRAHSSGGDAANLAPERYADYARVLVRALDEIRRTDGVTFTYVSPVNEPQWDWTGGQEGGPWRNEEIAAFARELSGALVEAGLPTRIELAETARLNYLYETADKPTRGAQARAFFDPASPHFVGDLPHVSPSLAAHSYFTTYPADTLRSVRRRVREELRAVDPELELVISEYCVLEDNPLIEGSGRDLGMNTALYVTGVIHSDLVDAEASAWQWWLAVSPYDYKDGLIYIDRDTLDGAVYESKLLWALGHYSRFVRPGMRRIEVTARDTVLVNGTDAELLTSAYRDPVTGRMVAVLVNRGEEARRVRLIGMRGGAVYRTTEDPDVNLRRDGSLSAEGELLVPGRSLVTVAGEGVTG